MGHRTFTKRNDHTAIASHVSKSRPLFDFLFFFFFLECHCRPHTSRTFCEHVQDDLENHREMMEIPDSYYRTKELNDLELSVPF